MTTAIDWSRCAEVESVADRCHGAPVIKGTRVMVQGILDNYEAGCSPEEIAREIFPSVTVEQVRRVLRFACHAQLLAEGLEPEVLMAQLLSEFDHGLMTEAELREALEEVAPLPPATER
jgi:uncharacterized protein (DUF433 family)